MLASNKILFRSKSQLDFYKYLFFQIIGVGIIVISGLHFSENPVFISIVILIVGFIIVVGSYDSLMVTTSRVEIRHNRILFLHSNSKKIELDKIGSIDIEIKLTKSNDFIALSSPYTSSLNLWNTLTIHYLDGSVTEIQTKIYKDDILKAMETIKEASHNRIKIRIEDLSGLSLK